MLFLLKYGKNGVCAEALPARVVVTSTRASAAAAGPRAERPRRRTCKRMAGTSGIRGDLTVTLAALQTADLHHLYAISRVPGPNRRRRPRAVLTVSSAAGQR